LTGGGGRFSRPVLLVVPPGRTPADRPPSPRHHLADTRVVRGARGGFTGRHLDVPSALRGTCAVLGTEPAVARLASLGVTFVESSAVHHEEPGTDVSMTAVTGSRRHGAERPTVGEEGGAVDMELTGEARKATT
jgi:hypothetical protein